MMALTGTVPYRGDTANRPRGVPLPPERMPLIRAGRLLKHWRYVSIWSQAIMICAARVHVGPVQQEFWGVWDRVEQQLYGRTRLIPGHVKVLPGRVLVSDRNAHIDITLDENAGLEVLTPDGNAYTWTRKQGGIRAHGSVVIGGKSRPVEAVALIDDNAGYHRRHTIWQWSGGAGVDVQGRRVTWSVIVGLNDSPENSERTIWIDGEPHEVGPVRFAADLSSITFSDDSVLHFTAEAVRQRKENLLLLRSAYRQPFGTFSGALPGGVALREAYGVMEYHEALW